MKRLILMRHAKARPAEVHQPDISRRLNDRGRREATALGDWLDLNGYTPDQALISSAVRTQETWAGVSAALSDVALIPAPSLYDADVGAMRKVLRTMGEGHVILMLGHQPGISAFGRRLLRDAPKDDEFIRYPTGATTVMDADIENWGAIDWHICKFVDFVVPRALA